jgi:uncharacterized protein YjdB
MKNKGKGLFSILLTMLMVFTLVTPVAAETTGDAATSVTIRLSAQAGKSFLVMPQEITVSSDKAEQYGYTDKEGVVTALDALVAAHEYVYGDAFTKENKENYLSVGSSGWVSKSFGSGDSFGFVVNGISSNDGVWVEKYGGYTGYTVGQAALQSEDDVEFFFYQDTTSWGDKCAWFEQNGKKVMTIETLEYTPIEFTLRGYSFMSYSCSTSEIISQYTNPIKSAQIILMDENGKVVNEQLGSTDENGKVTLNGLSKGVYYVSAYAADDDTPLISPVCEISVSGGSVTRLLEGISSQSDYVDTTNPWMILEMVKLGKRSSLTNISEYVESAKTTIAESSTATEVEKAIIALSALGYDVSNLTVNGEKINGIEKLLACNLNAVNANVFALCALDSGKYDVPENSQITRESLVTSLLNKQTKDNGWTYGAVDENTTADVDMTAMAVQSLAPYYLAKNAEEAGLSQTTYGKVKTAVEGALTCLSEKQADNGTYGNANSTEMVLMALSSVGVDGNTDSSFINNETSLLQGLLSYALTDNSGFGVTNNSSIDALATEQGFRALVSYQNFKSTNKPYNIYMSGSHDAFEVLVESVELDAKEKTIIKGQTDKLTVSVKPEEAHNKNVSWSSSDTSVATVNQEGVVSAVGEGTAVITVTAEDDSKKTVSCVITVKEQPKETVKNETESKNETEISTTETPVIKLNYSSLKLQKGKSTKVVTIKSSTPENEKIVSAISDKTSVATVSVKKGVMTITGKKKGTATITVTSTSGATAKVKITVAKKVNVKKLVLNKKRVTLKKGKKYNLTVTLNPVTATNKITWSSSNKKVATVTSKGVVKAKKKGKATITVKSSNGKKATCKVTVK